MEGSLLVLLLLQMLRRIDGGVCRVVDRARHRLCAKLLVMILRDLLEVAVVCKAQILTKVLLLLLLLMGETGLKQSVVE